MRYSKDQRDKAAMLCQLAASNPDVGSNLMQLAIDFGYDASYEKRRPDNVAVELAAEGWLCVNEGYAADDPARDALAKSMLRTGWAPK